MVVQAFCESAESDGVAEGRRRLGAVSACEPQDFWIESGVQAPTWVLETDRWSGRPYELLTSGQEAPQVLDSPAET